VRFDSDPQGARVTEGGRPLGTTPFETLLVGGPEGRKFGFHKDGYEEVWLDSDVTPGSLVSARLVAKPAAKTTRKATGGPAGRRYQPLDF
jgi:hypothetical protein